MNPFISDDGSRFGGTGHFRLSGRYRSGFGCSGQFLRGNSSYGSSRAMDLNNRVWDRRPVGLLGHRFGFIFQSTFNYYGRVRSSRLRGRG
jgi:hypothetical protein